MTNEREPLTHEIVRSVQMLTARLARHSEGNARAKADRYQNELAVLGAVLDDLPRDLFDMLGGAHCAHLSIVKHETRELFLMRVVASGGVGWSLTSGGVSMPVTTASVHDCFTLEEVIGGIVSALADCATQKHEAGRKIARVNRRLRGILSILDNS